MITGGGVDLKDQLLHTYKIEREKMTKWYLRLLGRLLNSTVLKSVVVYRQVMGRNIQQLLCLRNMRMLPRSWVYRGDRHLTTQFHAWLKDIFWEKWHPKLKNQNLRGGVVCAQSMEKRKLQCTAAKYVMWDFAWKIAVSCITQGSVTEVMTIILLHLYSFKISLPNFRKMESSH